MNRLDLAVDQGEILGLIGPNGAGKSTVLNLIDGTLRVSKGRIMFKGQNITRHGSHRRAQRGISRVFQRNSLFKSMTVLENMVAGSYLQTNHTPLGVVFRSFEHIRRQPKSVARCMELLAFVGLADRADEMAVSLPHGSQRELCVAVALAADPDLLLLDEPLTGMNAEETNSMIQIVKELNRERGTTTIIVEHNVKAVVGLCGRTVVLNYGEKLIEGDPRVCVGDPRVVEAYLGADADVL